jgi:phosphoribosylglycinamide formyltransferase-1
MKSYRIAVFTSGMSRGSNFEALVSWFRERKLPVEIAFVLITRRNAPITERCERLNIPVFYLPTKDWREFETELIKKCNDSNLDLIALAGFMKQMTPELIEGAGCPITNIHPALLPEFGGKGMYGSHVHEAVFQAQRKVSGASVHLVNPQYDEGPIIAQEKIDISGCNSPSEIGTTVLKVEHSLYGRAIWEYLNRNSNEDSR